MGLDLQRFAPPRSTTITTRKGKTVTFPGDPEVDDVAILLRLEPTVENAEGDALAEALVEGKATLIRLALQADPDQDLSDFKIGSEEMLMVFAFLVHGETVAEAVGIALTAHNLGLEKREDETDDDFAARIAEAAEVGAESPLGQPPSETSSSRRSSGSAAAEASAPATG